MNVEIKLYEFDESIVRVLDERKYITKDSYQSNPFVTLTTNEKTITLCHFGKIKHAILYAKGYAAQKKEPIIKFFNIETLKNFVLIDLGFVEGETYVTYSYPFCSNKEKEVFIEDARDYIATQISIELDVLKVDLDALYATVSD